MTEAEYRKLQKKAIQISDDESRHLRKSYSQKRNMEQNGLVMTRGEIERRKASAENAAAHKNISDGKILSVEEFKKNQSFGNKIISTAYDVAHNKAPQQIRAFGLGMGETIATPLQRAAYEVKQKFGLKPRTINGRIPYSDGERLSLTAKKTDGTIQF